MQMVIIDPISLRGKIDEITPDQFSAAVIEGKIGRVKCSDVRKETSLCKVYLL